MIYLFTFLIINLIFMNFTSIILIFLEIFIYLNLLDFINH